MLTKLDYNSKTINFYGDMSIIINKVHYDEKSVNEKCFFQGRETKTKSTKKKYLKNRVEVSDSEEEEEHNSGKLELLTLNVSKLKLWSHCTINRTVVHGDINIICSLNHNGTQYVDYCQNKQSVLRLNQL